MNHARLPVLVALAAVAFTGTTALRAQRRPRGPEFPQPLLALAISNLSFGLVLPGVPHTVLPRDSRNAGLFQVRGPAGASVRIDFVMPAALRLDNGGALLPLSFGPGDGVASFTRDPDTGGSPFNPHTPVIGSLGPGGFLYLRVGGTALPDRPQDGGEYHATIYLTVSDLGS